MTDSILTHLKSQAGTGPGSIAFHAPGYQKLDYMSLAATIDENIKKLNDLGIHKDTVIAFVADSEPATVILCLTLLSHATALPLNPDYKQHEIETLFSRVPVNALVIPANQGGIIRSTVEGLKIPVLEFDVNEWSIQYKHSSVLDNTGGSGQVILEKASLLLQTSGSTAAPRIVPLSTKNLLCATANVVESLSLTEQDICLHMLPMYHIGGIVDVLMAPLMSGGQVIFNRGFDTSTFFRLNTELAPTWTQTVPAMLQELVDIAGLDTLEAVQNRLRFIRSVSAPLPEALYHSAAQTFSTSIVEIYGMTESAGVITSNPLQAEKQKTGSAGINAGPELRIIAAHGEILGPMQTGEIQIRGDSVMQGYFRGPSSPDENSEFDNSWLKTGDTGYLDDDGYLFLTGRLKDIINRGGEKISPSEIDNVALQHPSVKDAAAFAIPHPHLGEDIAMALVIKPEDNVTEEIMREYLKEQLAYFKIPRHIALMEEIPRVNGKLQRWKLAGLVQTVENFHPHSSPSRHTPVDYLSRELANVWSKVLEIEGIGMEDDFFFLGGNSLLATVLVNQIQEKWGVQIIVSAIYDAPLLRDFEQHLKENYPELIKKIIAKSDD